MLNTNKKGFTIVEAMLSVALLSMAQLYRFSYEADTRKIEDATEFGKKLATIMVAMDKRILLDGQVDQTVNSTTGVVTKGDWNKSWSGVAAFADGMLNQELIGYNNPTCGNSVSGWHPKISDNDSAALVECNLLSANNLPFGFNVKAERSSVDATDKHIIGEWNFVLFYTNDTDFEDNFKYFAPIRQQAELHDALRMTGNHEVSYVNRTNNSTISSPSACYAAKSLCGIMFKYSKSNPAEASEESYIRVDGSTALVGDLYFETTAGTPERCYNHDAQIVSCGFDFDNATGELDVYANDITAKTFHLIHEDSGGTPVITYCNNKDETDSHPCGISVVNNSGSTVAKAHFDKLYARELFLSKIETDNDIVIRETFDSNLSAYSNAMTFSPSGMKFKNSAYGEKTIEFGEDMIVDGDSGGFKAIADKFEIQSYGDTRITSGGITKLITTNKTLNINQTKAQPNGMASKYGSAASGGLATKAFAMQGIKVMSMNVVKSGSTVPKNSCPIVDKAVTPTIQARTFPYGSYWTNLKDFNKSCSTSGSSFIDFNVYTPVIVQHGGSGTYPWKNATSLTASTQWNGKVNCDPTRDTSVSYQVDTSGSNWMPKFWFWGGSLTSYRTDVNMMVVQYCDYSQ